VASGSTLCGTIGTSASTFRFIRNGMAAIVMVTVKNTGMIAAATARATKEAVMAMAMTTNALVILPVTLQRST